MSKLESNYRQSIIIKTLRSKPKSFEEIQDVLNDYRDYNLLCSIRTFQRDLKEIESLYGIEIRYSRSEEVYKIADDQIGEHEERLLETFELLNALNFTEKHSRKMILEKRKPLGTQNMNGLLHAIENRLEVSFLHEKFWDTASGRQKRTVQPIALKEAQFRWYLIAKDTKDKKIKTFGLDRITQLDITKKRFAEIADYNPETAFRHCFGVINAEDKKPEKIVLSFTPMQANYIKSLPLHHSQKVILETEKECIIELYISPTYDFVMELMAMGREVKVVSPKSLQKEIRQKLSEALERY